MIKYYLGSLKNGYSLCIIGIVNDKVSTAHEICFVKENEKWVRKDNDNVTIGTLIDLDYDEISKENYDFIIDGFTNFCANDLSYINELIYKICCLMNSRIQSTYDASIFKHLKGNREITDIRVKKIENSIDKIGPIMTPLIVNENNEIIDGQGRCKAFSNKHLPISYIVIPGLGVTECRAMNIDQSNWSTEDWVDSHAEEGKESYVYFQRLINKYNNLNVATINNAITGATAIDNAAIKDGDFVCDAKTYTYAAEVLNYVSKFENVAKKTKMKGRRIYLLAAVAYCYSLSYIDKNRLFECFEKNHSGGSQIVNMDSALEEMERVYNKRCRKNNIYLKDSYKRMMDERDRRIKKNRKKVKK